MKSLIRITILMLTMASGGAAIAANSWNAESFDLYPGDFDGDGLTDILYISKDPRFANGVSLRSGSGFDTTLQTWGNAYLGIPWSDGTYNVVVADFDGDGKADLLLQPKGKGDSFLLITETGGVGAITQAIPAVANGLDWTGAAHRLVPGDFNGDGRADLFFQATDTMGVNAVLFSDAGGYFTASVPAQTWAEGSLGFNWATSKSNVFSGDFNGDGLADLLVQAIPERAESAGNWQLPVYTPNSYGVVVAAAKEKPFTLAGVQAWNEDGFNAHWSPLASVVSVADVDGDGKSDVVLQGVTSDDQTHVLRGRAPGAIFAKATALQSDTSPDAQAYRLLAGVFANGKSAGFYLQGMSPDTDNFLGTVRGTRLSLSAASLPTSNAGIANSAIALAAEPLVAAPIQTAALLAETTPGRTPGQFAVSAMGAATYQIPIWTPPGARGIEPKLAIVYQSGGIDGEMGPGWSLSGLSSITRCNTTYADNGGAPGAVNFCLDGNRLRVTNGLTYGSNGAQYQTQIADFSRVTSYGTAGTGPSYFIVERKDGLIYEYGNTANSKAYANSGTTPYAWMMNKVRDRQASPDNMTIDYSTVSGAIQPATIRYTQTPSTNGVTFPYSVSFTHQPRVTNLSRYVAGGNILQTQLLSKINVQSSGVSVRQYNMTYLTAPTTIRDRLIAVQECAGSTGTECLRPTTVGYQNGTAGIASPTTAAGSGPAVYGTLNSIDANGDGRSDLLFAAASGSNSVWYVQFATTTGFSAPINTGAVTTASQNALPDNWLGKGVVGLLAPSGGTWYLYQWNGLAVGSGAAFTSTSTGVAVEATLAWGQAASADTDGDGLPDLITAPAPTTSGFASFNINVRRNVTVGGSIAFATTVSSALESTYTRPYIMGNYAFPNSSVTRMDFGGDGRDEILLFSSKILTMQTTPTDYVSVYTGTAGFILTQGIPFSFFPVRWNSDACTDWVTTTATASTIAVNNCGGAGAQSMSVPSRMVVSADWDGDGLADILGKVGSVLYVYRSLGNAVSTGVSTGFSPVNANWAVIDQNGDGESDFAYAPSTTSYAIQYGLHNGASTPPDLVTDITDGWGITAQPSYVSIAQSNYTPYATATYPEINVTVPIYVVGSATQSDGTGGTFANYFWYYGARVALQGRGFEGFEATRSNDSRADIYNYVWYNQTYPYTGTVSKRESYRGTPNTLLNRTINTFGVTDLGGVGCAPTITNGASRCFPYLSGATTSSYEVNNAALVQTSVSSFTYDTNGNALTTQAQMTDNDAASPTSGSVWTSLMTNTYASDSVGSWCFGNPTRTTTQNSLTGQTTQTRTVDHAVDSAVCRNTSETVEPLSTTLKAVTTYGFDTCGNVNSLSIVGLDKNGATMPARTTTSSYGTRCTFPELVTNAFSQASTTAYNYSFGVKASSTDANGIAVSWLYDNFGRKTRENRPDGTYSTWSFSDCVAATCWGDTALNFYTYETQFDSASVAIRNVQDFFDAFGRLRYHEYHRALGVWTNERRVYDTLGRVQTEYVPYSSASNGYHIFSYDLLDRPVVDTLYNNAGAADRTTSMAYAGLKTTITDPRGNATTKWTDPSGKLRRIIDPAPGGTTNYAYDVFGNLTKMWDATTPTTSTPTAQYVYNIRGFKTSATDQDIGIWTYTPNSLNELIDQTDAKGQLISFGYDLLGRVTSRLEPESATPTTWVYGASAAAKNIGRLQSTSKPDGYAESYTFDSIGRPASAIITEDASYTISNTYNSIGALDTVTYPASTGAPFVLKYLYSSGAAYQVKDNAAGTVFWSLSSANDFSSPLSETLGNGIVVTNSYTPWTNDLLTRRDGTTTVLDSVQSLSYSWDKNGNLQQRQDLKQSLTEAFVHDTLNRISSSTLNGGTNLTVGYDAAGNITSRSDIGAYNYSAAQGACNYIGLTAQPHAVRNAGGAVYCYDKNGNATSKNGGVIAWTSYNLPSSIASGANSTTFQYNASHQRWKQIAIYGGTAETTYYIGGLMEKVTTGANPTEYRHLIPAGSATVVYTRRSNGTSATTYLTSDHLGSGDVVMDSSGAVLAKQSFTPFGARRGSNWQGVPSVADYTTFASTTRRGFTGHEMLDSVGLVHMNGRVYDPTIGRFLSADPIIQTIQLSQAINPFSYVMNMPLMLTDPSGYSWFKKLFHSIGHFLKKFWRPILAIVVAVVSFGTLLPYCVAFAGSAIADGMIAGAIAGAVAGGITGGWKGALVGALSGAMFGGIAGGYGEAWTMGRVAENAVAGGISSEASGGKFKQGFILSGLLALSQYSYNKVMKYDVTWKKGDGLASTDGTYDEAFPVPKNPNVFGTNERLNPSGGGNFWKQGGWLSRHVDPIPGMHSLSRLHDYFQIRLGGISSFARNFGNVPAMIPATVINYASLLSTVPGYTAILDEN